MCVSGTIFSSRFIYWSSAHLWQQDGVCGTNSESPPVWVHGDGEHVSQCSSVATGGFTGVWTSGALWPRGRREMLAEAFIGGLSLCRRFNDKKKT